MCKFCNVITEGAEAGLGEYQELLTMEYGTGIRTTLGMYVSDTCRDLELTKNISEDGNDWYEITSETKTLEINYCPFCGRKL